MRSIIEQIGRRSVKSLIVTGLYRSGGLRLFRWLNRNRLVILTYHGVLPADSGTNDYLARNFVEEGEFRRQMHYLANHYRCISLSDAVERLANGWPLPPYAVAVTFDDGYRNNLRYAYPILREHAIPCTIFLATGNIGPKAERLWTDKVSLLITHTTHQSLSFDHEGTVTNLLLRSHEERAQACRHVLTAMKAASSGTRETMIAALENRLGSTNGVSRSSRERYDFLSWDEVGGADSELVEWGAHTVHHQILTTLDDEQLMTEIEQSKRKIETRLHRPCLLFSYPNGSPTDFGEREKQALKKSGFACAVTQVAGMNGPRSDLYKLRRINIGRGHRGALFIAQVSGLWSMMKRIPECFKQP